MYELSALLLTIATSAERRWHITAFIFMAFVIDISPFFSLFSGYPKFVYYPAAVFDVNFIFRYFLPWEKEKRKENIVFFFCLFFLVFIFFFLTCFLTLLILFFFYPFIFSSFLIFFPKNNFFLILWYNLSCPFFIRYFNFFFLISVLLFLI